MLPVEVDKIEIDVLGDFEVDFVTNNPKFNFRPDVQGLFERYSVLYLRSTSY